MIVYVAGPITLGHRLMNIRQACVAAAELMRAGHTPFVPHLFDFIDFVAGETYDYKGWMDFDAVWLEKCEALIRLPGESAGADTEVLFMNAMGRPVYYTVEAFLEAQK